MGEKLSTVMILSLQAIESSGGAAIPEGGGWWKGKNGQRLSYEPPTDSLRTTVGTLTIYALNRRGALKRRFVGLAHQDITT